MINAPTHLFSNLMLGDIVETYSGALETVRAVASVAYNIADIDGLCILGDMNAALLCRKDDTTTVIMLVPVQNIPKGAQTAHYLASGLVSFWAPHLPAIGGALSTSKYELMLFEDTQNLFVRVVRGNETIFFDNAASVQASTFSIGHQKLSPLNKTKVTRYAATIDESYVSHIPSVLPQRVKVSPRRSLF